MKREDFEDLLVMGMITALTLLCFTAFLKAADVQQGRQERLERVPTEDHRPAIPKCEDVELWDCIRRKDI